MKYFNSVYETTNKKCSFCFFKAEMCGNNTFSVYFLDIFVNEIYMNIDRCGACLELGTILTTMQVFIEILLQISTVALPIYFSFLIVMIKRF